jgi:mRNA interferase YafQ
MRKIERTNVFKRDFKREKRSGLGSELDSLVTEIVSLLAEDKPLPVKNRDHALTGNWRDHRECHLKPDLLLIYRKPDADILRSFAWALIANFLTDVPHKIALLAPNPRFHMIK